jgi:release factor glutamine methyltransferase
METWGAALAWARERFAPISESPRLDAEVLLADVTGASRAQVLAWPERPLDESQTRDFRARVDLRSRGEPVAYLIGAREFYGRRFTVTPDVLIPRPETEHLVEVALAWCADRPPNPRIIDVGTGSGIIALTLAAEIPGARIWGTDRSAAALEIARRNADRLHLKGRVMWLLGDLLSAAHGPFDIIAANLPYIPSAELGALEVARHEPRIALDGGPDGLGPIRRLLKQARLSRPGLLLLEIGTGQAEAVSLLARDRFPGANSHWIHDYGGHVRVIAIEVT